MLLAAAQRASVDRAEFEALAAEVAVLRTEVARLAAGRGPRATEDRRLLAAIYDAAEGLPWQTSHLLTRAEQVPALRLALLNADLTTSKELGKWAARMAGIEVDDLMLVRVRRRLWRVSRV